MRISANFSSPAPGRGSAWVLVPVMLKLASCLLPLITLFICFDWGRAFAKKSLLFTYDYMDELHTLAKSGVESYVHNLGQGQGMSNYKTSTLISEKKIIKMVV